MADLEILARLGPKAIRLDTGRGGVPELTDQDIAAGLGFASPTIGRAVIELMYLPAVGQREIDKACGLIYAMAAAEWRRRKDDVATAAISHEMAKLLAQRNRDRSEACKRHLSTLEGKAYVAGLNSWPDNLHSRLDALSEVLLSDLLADKKPTNVEIAKAIGVGESAYRQSWAKVYDWLYSAIVDSRHAAAREIMRALKREAA